ncbi:MAG: MFS transporter [Vibrio sp.]
MFCENLKKIYILNQSLQWFMIGLILPILTVFQVEKGLDLFEVGIVMGVYSTSIILLELPTGALADTIGRKKVFILSLILMFVAFFGMLISQEFWHYVIAFAFLGASRSLSSGTIDAWFIDEFEKKYPDGNLQETLAMVGIFITLSLGGASLLGGYIPMSSLSVIISHIAGFDIYSLNLMFALFLVLCQIFLTSVLVKEERTLEHQTKGILSGLMAFPSIITTSVHYGLKNHLVFLLILASGVWGFSLSGVEILWQPKAKELAGAEFQTSILGILGAGYFFAGAFGSYISIPLCRLFKNDYAFVLFMMRFLMGTVLVIMAISTTQTGFAFAYWTFFLINGVKESPHATIYNEAIPSGKRSTMLSFESFVMQIGGLVGSICLGYVAKNFSIEYAWTFAGALIISSSFLYILVRKQRQLVLIKQAGDLKLSD